MVCCYPYLIVEESWLTEMEGLADNTGRGRKDFLFLQKAVTVLGRASVWS